MKLFVSIPTRYTESMYRHKGDKSPAVFVLEAIKHYIDTIESGVNISTREREDEGNKNTVRLD